MPIYLQHGNLIDYVPPTDTSTEDVVFMGGLVGIPQTFIPAGELGALSVDGVYMFTKKDGVSVNLGEVVKYCGTTKLAQDSNADLTLGVAVADAEADSLGVKVKINSVLPTDGGGGSGEVALCGDSGLYFDGNRVAIKYCGNSAINADTNGVYLAVCGDSGLSIQNGELVASGGGGGGGGSGIQNLATGIDSLSILGEATTSFFSITIGNYANASGDYSIALGYKAKASVNYSTALGHDVQVHDECITAIGARAYSLRTQLYVIPEGSSLSQQYLNNKAGLAYAVWGDEEIYPNGKVKEGKIIAFETLFANGVDFVPTTEEPSPPCCC